VIFPAHSHGQLSARKNTPLRLSLQRFPSGSQTFRINNSSNKWFFDWFLDWFQQDHHVIAEDLEGPMYHLAEGDQYC